MSGHEYALLLHVSRDGGSTFTELSGLEVCKSCKQNTLVCEHKLSREERILQIPAHTTHIKLKRAEGNSRLTQCPARNSRLAKITDNLKFTILESLLVLEEIWQEIGIKDEQKEKRNQSVFQYVQELLTDMISEEEQLKEKMKQSTLEYKKELEILYKDLDLPPRPIPSDMLLVELETKLRSEVDTLNKEKHDRLKTLKRLRVDELELCDRMLMPKHEFTFVGCPNLEQLRELEQNVKFLKAEKLKRLELFKKRQASIIQLWKELDIEPFTDLEKELCSSSADESFILSSQQLDLLAELQARLDAEHKELMSKLTSLREKVKSLQDRLDIDLGEREKFNAQVSENSPRIAKLLVNELGCLEELKRQHMQKFLESLRKEILMLWGKCYFGEDQRQLFRPFYTEEYTEDVLAEHEHQVTTLKNFYEENKDIFKLAEKREKLWNVKVEFESQPTNLNARGGALLKQEKLRKAIEKDLPKIEQELKKKVDAWEKQNEDYFVFNGLRYMDYLEDQKKKYEQDKEDRKIIKIRQKQEELHEECVFGSRSKRPMGTTPVPGGKRAKIDMTGTPSRFIHSSVLPSPCKKPTGSENRPVACKPQVSGCKAKMKKSASQVRRQSAKRRSIRLLNTRRVLSDKNQTCVPETILERTKVVSGSLVARPSANVSLMSYNEFADAVGEQHPFSRSSFMAAPSKDERAAKFVI